MARLTSPFVLRAQYSRTLQNASSVQSALSLPLAPTRNSSMSAIVRGVRRTFRDADGSRPPGYNPAVAERVGERRRARDAAGPKSYKILRGKKDVTEPPIPKAKTRRARFFDPEEDHGKKSFVYQAKTGALEAEVTSLRQELKPEHTGRAQRDSGGDEWDKLEQLQESSGRDNRRGSRGGRGSGFPSRSGGRGGSTRGRGGYEQNGASRPPRFNEEKRDSYREREDRPRERTVFAESQRSDWKPQGRYAPRGDAQSVGRGTFTGGDRRRTFGDRDNRRDDRRVGGWDNQNSREERPDRRSSSGRDSDSASFQNFDADPDASFSLPYTTAASQFLYGRSVAEAALRSGRRKLYKLYIYGGSSRGSDTRAKMRALLPSDDQLTDVLERLAKRKNVEVKIVDEKWQRLLDRMSKGRPHNGIVLEASPLPQPPLKGLGRYKEDGNKPPRFNIQLDHQSREDAEINGTATFVAVRTPPLPVVDQAEEEQVEEQSEEEAAVATEEETTIEEQETLEGLSDEPAVDTASAGIASDDTSLETSTEATAEPADTEPTDEPEVAIETQKNDAGNAAAETASEASTANTITASSVRTTAPHRFYRPLVLLLDQVLDPGNLGAILRSASFLGVSAVAVSRHGSATLSSVALKASAGASEDLPLFTVDKPAEFLSQSRKSGWRVYSTVPKPTFTGDDKRNSYDLDGLEKADPLRKQPCILVIGSEGEGLSRAIRRKADAEVTIPNQSGASTVDSLNVSVAAGLVCASFLRGATRASNEAGLHSVTGSEFDDDYEARPNELNIG